MEDLQDRLLSYANRCLRIVAKAVRPVALKSLGGKSAADPHHLLKTLKEHWKSSGFDIHFGGEQGLVRVRALLKLRNRVAHHAALFPQEIRRALKAAEILLGWVSEKEHVAAAKKLANEFEREMNPKPKNTPPPTASSPPPVPTFQSPDTAADIAMQNSGRAGEIRHRVILFRINKYFKHGMSDEEIYEGTRGVWRIGARRNRAEYAFGVVHGIVRGVYTVSKWHPAGTTSYRFRPANETRASNRWEFVGKTAPRKILDLYLHTDVRHCLPKQGGQNPVCYAGNWNQ